jgi:hypothetical protein
VVPRSLDEYKKLDFNASKLSDLQFSTASVVSIVSAETHVFPLILTPPHHLNNHQYHPEAAGCIILANLSLTTHR